MSVPSTSWDETNPAGSQARSLGDDRIRELKTQIREVINIDHDFPSSGSAADNGQHKQVTLQEQANLGTGAVNATILGSQTVAGKGELVYTDEDNNDVQITNGGKINGASVGTTAVPATAGGTGQTTITQGDIIFGSAANVLSKLSPSTAGMFLKTLGAGANPLWSFSPNFKISFVSRDETVASGTQSEVSMGFRPRFIMFFGANSTSQRHYFGMSDATNQFCMYTFDITQYMANDSSKCIRTNSATNFNTATVAFDADGFTLTWVKTGSPTGTMNAFYLAFQ